LKYRYRERCLVKEQLLLCLIYNIDFDLFYRYASNADYLSTDDLLLFLEAEQGVRLTELL
jgi:hypothetical protein